jgi:hypothetical protein
MRHQVCAVALLAVLILSIGVAVAAQDAYWGDGWDTTTIWKVEYTSPWSLVANYYTTQFSFRCLFAASRGTAWYDTSTYARDVMYLPYVYEIDEGHWKLVAWYWTEQKWVHQTKRTSTFCGCSRPKFELPDSNGLVWRINGM